MAIASTVAIVAIDARAYSRLQAERLTYRQALERIALYKRGHINGWILRALPAVAELIRMAERALKGEE
jgi:hypothetical protein